VLHQGPQEPAEDTCKQRPNPVVCTGKEHPPAWHSSAKNLAVLMKTPKGLVQPAHDGRTCQQLFNCRCRIYSPLAAASSAFRSKPLFVGWNERSEVPPFGYGHLWHLRALHGCHRLLATCELFNGKKSTGWQAARGTHHQHFCALRDPCGSTHICEIRVIRVICGLSLCPNEA
jgi:hypothetical protein